MSCIEVCTRSALAHTHTHTLQSSRNLWAAYTEHKTGDLQQCEGPYSTEDLFLCGIGSHYTQRYMLTYPHCPCRCWDRATGRIKWSLMYYYLVRVFLCMQSCDTNKITLSNSVEDDLLLCKYASERLLLPAVRPLISETHTHICIKIRAGGKNRTIFMILFVKLWNGKFNKWKNPLWHFSLEILQIVAAGKNK